MKTLFVAVLCLVVSIGQSQAPKCLPITCTSTGRPKHCTRSLSRSHQISAIYANALSANVDGDPGKPCKEGLHYGIAPREIWVDLKCGGNFSICVRLNTDLACTVKLLSTTSSTRKKYYIIDLNDDIYLMYVQKKLNDKCIKGETYGKEKNRVWVSSGCRGRFYICVDNKSK